MLDSEMARRGVEIVVKSLFDCWMRRERGSGFEGVDICCIYIHPWSHKRWYVAVEEVVYSKWHARLDEVAEPNSTAT